MIRSLSALKHRDPRPEYRDELASVVGRLVSSS
jgi:hypothetical protein